MTRHSWALVQSSILRLDRVAIISGTSADTVRALQVAWLLLLSTYEGNLQPSCYIGRDNVNGQVELLTLQIIKTGTVQDHLVRLQKDAVANEEENTVPRSVIWNGSVAEARAWVIRHDGRESRSSLEMALVLDEAGESRHVNLLYNTSTVHEDSATGRIETLRNVLSAMAKSTDCIVGDMSFLSDYDKRRIVAWNQPGPEGPTSMTIHAGFAINVEAFPDAPAIYAWDGEITYLELDLESTKLASFCRRSWRSTGNMVLFSMNKSKWALVAALAILKVGKAIVPVDWSWPRARLDQVVELTGARLAICDKETAPSVEPYSCEVVIVPHLQDGKSDSAYDEPQTDCAPHDLAFVLFSSGSTGVPKGMLRQHDTACTGSFAHAKAMHLERTSRVLQFANHVFDVAMLDFFTTLLVGGCVCIPSETDRKNGLAAFVEKSQANWALLTPTVADLLDPVTVPSLKYVTLGGESIKESTLRKWLKSSRVGINYGSAEVDVTHARDVSDETDILNVGHRLPSCLAYIVDPDDPAVILPVGAVGELVISGPTMARGYLNAHIKTAEVFLQVPQAWISQGLIEKPRTPWTSRVYRMGDLFRQMSDGSLQFVGRKDFQVKVNGQKVELGDIESKLSRHPDVSHCAVIYPADGPYAKRLVAITQSTRATTPASRHARAANKTALTLSLPAVTEYLQNLIPSFMLPSVLIVVETMPFTPTMKIDRTRLKKCLSDNEVSAGSVPGFMHVSTALSGTRLLASEKSAMKVSNLIADIISAPGSAIWKSISGHDNRLTDIGINSAQAMRLAASVRKQFGGKILFETLSQPCMTVRKLVMLLESDKQHLVTDMACNDAHTQVEFLKERVARHTETVLNTSVVRPPRSRHVFLTGATGYLGVQILCQLLSSSNIASVTVLVRTSSRQQGLERVRLALAAVQADTSRRTELHAWPGDLSKPRMGLSDADWMRLSEEYDNADTDGSRIDTIIHCGAVVNWTKSYSDLEAPNVHSTEELLKLVRTCHHLGRFVFVSGGRYPNPAQDVERDLEALYTDVAKDNGYAQTKFVAERLVHNARSALQDKSISVVCPAYLIGSGQHGLANQDDYLWRVVWASVRIGAFNADERDQWLFVAQSDAVAERIVALTLLDFKASSSTTLNVLDGLSVGKFWSIVSEELAIPLMEQSGDVWLQKVKFDMEETSDHLLWPLADSLESGRGLLTRQRYRAKDVGAESDSKDIEAAVRANVEYLHKAGFFSGVKPE